MKRPPTEWRQRKSLKTIRLCTICAQNQITHDFLARLSKNPPVLAVFAGLLMVALAIELPVYLTKLVTFSAYAAAPTALFSMGIVIYNTPILAQLKFAVAIRTKMHPL